MIADRNARTGRGRLARSVGAAFTGALILLTAVVPATASATTVEFPRSNWVAPLGQPFPDPIKVTVKNDGGDPVQDAVVAFAVTPDSTGATATISAPEATTDANGVAQITGTAGTLPGFPRVTATVDGASAQARLIARPPGYVPGEQLASVEAQNQDGVTENLRDGLDNKTFVLVDVCAGWCGPCRQFAQDTEEAIAALAAVHGIRLKLATVLMEGVNGGQASDQLDAQNWKNVNDLTGSVLHGGGTFQSDLSRAAAWFLYENDNLVPNGAFPTHLLVDQKGKILDRRVGAETAEQTVDRVLAAGGKTAKPPKPPKPSAQTAVGEVGIELPGGQAHSEVFDAFDIHFVEWGIVALFGEDANGIATRDWQYVTPDVLEPLAASGTLKMSLTRFGKEAKQPLTSSTVPVGGVMQHNAGEVDEAYVTAETTLPAVQNKKTGTVTVPVDLAALRSTLRTQIEAGQYEVIGGSLPELTPEVIDGLVDSLFSVAVRTQYTIGK